MNTYLKYQPAGVQFLAFIGLAAGCFVVNGILLTTLFADMAAAVANKQAVITPALVVQFKWAQLLGSLLTFIIPALLFSYYSSPKPLPYVGVRKTVSVPLVLASILLLLAVQPFVGWLGDLNTKIHFGSFQKTMEEAEANYTRLLQSFLVMRSVGDVLINLFIMALLPAIGEELFFRGAFQTALLRLTKQPIAAILVSSLVFAVLHGTIFKFIPIFALGIILGTVYYRTRNLWYTIIIHFLNNALAVLATYYATRVQFLQKLANDDLHIQWYAAIFSLLVAAVLIILMARKSDEVLPAHVANDDNDYIA